MKLLKNGCKRSEIKVIPNNWKSTTSVRKDWLIYYRFYDPQHTGPGTKYPKGKLMVTRGMNEFKTIDERWDYTTTTIISIKHDLDECDYNPITGYEKQWFEQEKTDYEIQ